MEIAHLLAHVGKPMSGEDAVVVTSLQEVFTEVYQASYEAKCVLDHKQAERVTTEIAIEARTLAMRAYQRAWQVHQDPEFCGLVADDVYTLTALLHHTNGYLTDFQTQRLAWIARGRFPCGYRGVFPFGKWVVV
jgi:hypothetical protein